MNYIDLINNFWHKDLEHNFTTTEAALYFYILKCANAARWKNPLGLSNALVMAKFGIGKTAFDTAKRNLKNAGLIDFRAGDGRGKVYQYEIKVLKKVYPNDTLSDNLSTTLSDTLSELKPDTSINSKLNIPFTLLKEKAMPVKKPPRKKTPPGSAPPPSLEYWEQAWAELECSFSENMKGLWQTLCQSKKWSKKDYSAILLSLKKLMGYKEGFAVNLVEAAIGGGWQGVVFSSTNDDYKKWLSNEGNSQDTAYKGKQNGASSGRGASIGDLQALKRNTGPGSDERSEFSRIEVIK